jgi:hypothetical protein
MDDEKKPQRIGALEGLGSIGPEFFDPLPPDELAAWEGGDVDEPMMVCRISIPGHRMREISFDPPLSDEELTLMALNSDAVFERSKSNPANVGMWPKEVHYPQNMLLTRERINALALEVLGSEAAAQAWMASPQKLLGREVVPTEMGNTQWELSQIEWALRHVKQN